MHLIAKVADWHESTVQISVNTIMQILAIGQGRRILVLVVDQGHVIRMQAVGKKGRGILVVDHGHVIRMQVVGKKGRGILSQVLDLRRRILDHAVGNRSPEVHQVIVDLVVIGQGHTMVLGALPCSKINSNTVIQRGA